jgi:hypothetical protein
LFCRKTPVETYDGCSAKRHLSLNRIQRRELMARQTLDCPHCRMKNPMRSGGYTYLSRIRSYFWFVCPVCTLPLALLAEADKPPHDFRDSSNVNCEALTFKECGWRVLGSWPKPQYQKVEPPRGVPEEIGKLFAQSQEVALNGGYDLAILGFVRVLKMAQAATSLQPLKKPHGWVLSLVRDGRLTKDMREWANRVKGLRTEVEGAAAKDAEELATFVYILLEQLFAVRSRASSFRAAESSPD